MRKRIDLRVHLPRWITKNFPSAIWHMPTGKKTLYLTFDDGPIPEVTPQVLDILDKYNIKATFFCVGENVFKYPNLYETIIEKGHSIGNHTFNHLQGLKSTDRKYIMNIEKAAKLIDSDLFRPPHGFMTRTQYLSTIRKYKLVMWDVISCDYDPRISPNKCFHNVVDFVQDGSIITFHDSEKAKNNVLKALPKCIEYLLNEGYEFKPIEFVSDKPFKLQPVTPYTQSIRYNLNRLLRGA